MAVKIHEKLKEIQLNVLIDIFEDPEKFKIGNVTLKKCFNENLNKERLMLTEIFNLAQTISIDIESTRAMKNVDILEQIIESYASMLKEENIESTEFKEHKVR